MNSAVYFILFATFFAFGSCQKAGAPGKNMPPEMLEKLKKCNETYPVSNGTLENIMKSKSLTAADESNENLLCNMKCMMTGTELDTNGKFNEELAIQNFKKCPLFNEPPAPGKRPKIISEGAIKQIAKAVNTCVNSAGQSATEGCKISAVLVKCASSTMQQLKNKMELFSMQLLHNNYNITAYGLVNIDLTLLFTITGAAPTYLVLLFQFGNEKTIVCNIIIVF